MSGPVTTDDGEVSCAVGDLICNGSPKMLRRARCGDRCPNAMAGERALNVLDAHGLSASVRIHDDLPVLAGHLATSEATMPLSMAVIASAATVR
jgi:hypothetical protein